MVPVETSGVEASPPEQVIDERRLDERAVLVLQHKTGGQARRRRERPERRAAREELRPGRPEYIGCRNPEGMDGACPRAARGETYQPRAHDHTRSPAAPPGFRSRSSVCSSIHEPPRPRQRPGARRNLPEGSSRPTPRARSHGSIGAQVYGAGAVWRRRGATQPSVPARPSQPESSHLKSDRDENGRVEVNRR